MNGSSGENAYTILETIHKSKHHCVYKAKNYFKGFLVTIKTNDQRLKTDPLLNQELKHEIEIGLKLKHPNIRETIGVFEDEGTVYAVCRYVEGDPLNSLLSAAKVEISFENALKWTLQLLDAQAHAHSHDAIHLNLNTSNIIITPDYNLIVFGFGKNPGDWKTADPDKDGYHPVLFTAPELFTGDRTDARSDIYSLGVLAYLLFCGQLPWSLDRRDTPSQQKQQTFQRPALNPELLGKRVPHWLFNILNKSLMLDPDKRFTSALEMRQAIESRQEIPYESCLNRSVKEAFRPSVSLVVFPEQPEPIIAVSTSTQVQPIEWPAEQKEPSIVSSQEPISHILQQTTPLQPVTERPQSVTSSEQYRKPSPPPSPIKNAPNPVTDKAEQVEVSKMRHLLRILGIVSILILAYIIVKYLIIPDTPSFSKVDKEERASSDDNEFKTPNQPIPMVAVIGDTIVVGHIGADAEDDEFPPREVKVPAFYIGIHEVTCEEWAMATPGFVVDNREKDLPITRVSFYDVLDYCNAKSKLDGYKPCYEFFGDDVDCDFTADGYRLPTEAEWEYAAKGLNSGQFTLYSGSNSPNSAGWYEENSNGELHRVGELDENSLGVFDMSGNAYEWVWNWYGRYSENQNAIYSGPESGTDKVIRGGSWKHPANEMRVTNRSFAKPLSLTDYIGFRVVRTRK